jgi:hypothetical protein
MVLEMTTLDKETIVYKPLSHTAQYPSISVDLLGGILLPI